MVKRVHDSRGKVPQFQFAEDMTHMGFHDDLRDSQRVGYLTVGPAPADQGRSLVFAAGQFPAGGPADATAEVR